MGVCGLEVALLAELLELSTDRCGLEQSGDGAIAEDCIDQGGEQIIFLFVVGVPIELKLVALLIDEHGFHIAEAVETEGAFVATEAAFFRTAEGQGRVTLGREDVVNGYVTRDDLPRDAFAAFSVFGPYAGA